jgi:hypothetical protein
MEVSEELERQKERVGDNYLIECVAETIEDLSAVIAERLKAGYPYSSDNLELPLVSYRGSFQKILKMTEWIGSKVFSRGNERFYNKLGIVSDIHTSNMILCNRISNRPAPETKHTYELSYAFNYLPTHFLLFTEHLFYYFHEIGHVFLNFSTSAYFNDYLVQSVKDDEDIQNEQEDFDSWHKATFGISDEVERIEAATLVKELLCDLFAIYCGMNGTWELYIRLLKEIAIVLKFSPFDHEQLTRRIEFVELVVQCDNLESIEINYANNIEQYTQEYLKQKWCQKMVEALKTSRGEDPSTPPFPELKKLFEVASSYYLDSTDSLPEMMEARKRAIHQLWFLSLFSST